MSSITRHLMPQLAALAPELIIFDKGGTLIDFHGMWSGWVIELARRLEVAAGIPVADRLFRAIGFDFMPSISPTMDGWRRPRWRACGH